MISDIESVAQQVQRSLGNGNYKTPIIAGIGEGGALVLGMASQTPPATIGEAVAIDPKAAVPLQKELCTPADKKTVPEGIIYGLSEGELPMPISIIQSKSADEESKRHSKELQAAHPDVDIESVDAEPVDALLKALSDAIVASAALEEPLGLPLTILDTKPKWDTIASSTPATAAGAISTAKSVRCCNRTVCLSLVSMRFAISGRRRSPSRHPPT